MKITASNRSEIRAKILLARAGMAGLASVSAFAHVESLPAEPAQSVKHSLTVETQEAQDDKEAARIKAETLAIRKTNDETREEREIGAVSPLEIEAETLACGLAVSESAVLLSKSEKRKLANEVTQYRIAQDLRAFDQGKARNSWLILV